LDGDLEDFTVPRDPAPHQAVSPREHVRLAGEVSGVMHDDEILPAVVRADDLERTVDDHEERDGFGTLVEEHLSAPHAPPDPMRLDASDLPRRERREELSRAFGGWIGRVGHGGHSGPALESRRAS